MQLFYCRAGFEPDCAAELAAEALSAGAQGRCDYEPKQGYVLWRPAKDTSGSRRAWAPALTDLVFARQRIDRLKHVDALLGPDRVAPLLEAANSLGPRFSAVWIEAPDSEAGRKILGNARNLLESLEAGLRAYERVARLAASLVKDGGYLGLCSCSHAADLARFRAASARGIGKAGRRGQIIYTGFAGPDHPMMPQLAESGYLKAVFFRL